MSRVTFSAPPHWVRLGRRTHKSGTGVAEAFFLDDEGGNEIAEYDGTGALTRRFLPGPSINDPVAMVKGSDGKPLQGFPSDYLVLSAAGGAVVEFGVKSPEACAQRALKRFSEEEPEISF